jgi:NADH-quinone oxidoreductase subunit J
MEYALYIASTLGAVSLFMMMPRRGLNLAVLGAILGAATLGGLWLWLARGFEDDGERLGGGMVWYYVFSALAIGSAARVITHKRPVYAALWFVMVVLASSGLLLVLMAEFMAFAMIIIYGGAILVTYVFVIMLASQSGEGPAGEEVGPTYDRIAREPAAAVFAGFVLLAMLLAVAFQPMRPNPAAAAPSDETIVATVLTERAASRREQGDAGPNRIAVGDPGELHNAERIGLDLFQSHPLGLELAGVILLVSLVGAVVIARQRVELEERLGTEPGPGGATVTQTDEPGPHDPQTLEAAASGRMGA